MTQFTFFNPVRLLFGAGTFEKLGEHAAAHGSRSLLVTGRTSARSSGLLTRAVRLLAAAGLQVTVFDRVMPNPTAAIVDEGAALAREAGCDLIVGVGGGSAMDAAKAIAVCAAHEGPAVEFLRVEDKREPTEATLPIICATTTAGTSSELTRFAVITVEELTQKSSIASDLIFPRVAIVDPELTVSCPPSVTANVGVDVLAHAVEGYFSTVASPVTDACAERAIALVARHLPRAVADGTDLDARTGMALANVFAGYVLSNCGATVLHGLEHPISAHYPQVAHGAGLAVMMVAWAERFWDRDPLKFGRIAKALGRWVPGAPLEQSAEFAADAIRALLSRIGLDLGLADLGVERDKLQVIADDALRYMGGAVEKTPADLSRDDLIELLEASYHRGE
ncbi:MAG: iron-containing alcohol dehydrogenase [Armatimonadota bacterium]